MRKIQIGLLALTAFFATGCPKYRPSVDFNSSSTFIGRLNAHLKVEQLKARCYSLNLSYSDPSASNPTGCSSTPNSMPGGKELAKGIRNNLIEDALPYIDDAYGDFKNDLAAGRDRQNFIADLIELGTSAAVGITNGQRPLQIMGIGLTAFRGGRRSADANFFKNQSTPILISKMNGNRANVRAIIISNEAKSIDEYPVGRAISDIVEYYNAGTLVEAFNKLAEDTAVQTKASEKAVRLVRGDLDITDIPTVAAEQVSAAILKQRESLEDQKDAADAEAAKITVPAPTATNATEIANAQALRVAKLKPIRDKLVTIWNETKAQTAFASAINRMKAKDQYKDVLAKLDANPPQPVTEEDYLTLLRGLSAELGPDAEASKQFLALLQRLNK